MSILQMCGLARSALMELLHISTNFPMLAVFSKIAKINKTDLDIKLVSSTFKVRNIFSVKGSVQ